MRQNRFTAGIRLSQLYTNSPTTDTVELCKIQYVVCTKHFERSEDNHRFLGTPGT